MPTVAFHTLGCKLNYAETMALGRQFSERGYAVVNPDQGANVCVINTCSVTARADRECRQLIRRALRSSPGAYVVVTGCYAQLEPEEVASIDGVNLVLGSCEKSRMVEYLALLERDGPPRVVVSNIGTADDFGPAASAGDGGRTRAYLKVQDGCDYSCSFCTIPLARGRSRSQSVEQCVVQAKELVEQGYREIVLTGVNVGDYGKRLGTGLLTLLGALVDIEGLDRLRVSSIEPNLLTPALMEFAAAEPKMCKHFHVPLQSGSDVILQRMRRRYTTAQFASLIHRLRARFPECGIGVDVIAGFPGETDALFEETYRFLTELPVSYLHAFTYSERPHTPAASWRSTVEPRVRFRRNDMLRILSSKKRDAFFHAMLGKEARVLTENRVEGGFRFGLTDSYIRVGVPAEAAVENQLVRVNITGIVDDSCRGEVIPERVEG